MTKEDIISACFLLNYAKDARELLAMCISIKKNLGENGKFYGTVPQPPKYPNIRHTLIFFII